MRNNPPPHSAIPRVDDVFGKAMDQSSMTDAYSSYKTTERDYTVGADSKVAGAVRSSNK